MSLVAAFISSNLQEWTREEFHTFLLIYASYADYEFSESEKHAILQRVNENTFNRVSDYFHKMGEYERLDHILQFRSRFFPDEESKKALLDLMSDHFQADGEVSRPELNLRSFLERLL